MGLKQLILNARNTINELTGQDKKIEEYNLITRALAEASDEEANSIKKQKISQAYKALDETKYTTIPSGSGFTIGGFNPYLVFQNKLLTKKIKSGNEALQKLGIQLN